MIENGSYVKHRITGERGRVYSLYSVCPFSDGSLSRMTTVGENPMRFVNSPWVSVVPENDDNPRDVDWYPVDIFEEIEPFKLKYRHYSSYFVD